MKILCIGHAAYDITLPVEHLPIENTKNRIHSRVECGGGPASNAAYLLGKWGLDTTFMGIVGNDLYGRNIKKEFEEVNVDTTYLQMSDEDITPSSIIIANRENGSRTIFTYRPSDMVMSDVNINFKPDIILVDGQEPGLSTKIIKQFPDAISIIDAGRSRKEVVELSKLVTYVVCSKEFAEEVTELKIDYDDWDSIINLYHKMEEIFPNHIVITLESKGCLYKHQGEIKIMPSIQVKAVDSTGAGDIFHGAFTYGIAKNFDYEKTLKFANIAGAISVTRIGGRYSVPTLQEMDEVYNEFK
ncbi:MAG: PfkB family carbohydrate kinase [Bacilli bacterium]|nr:PfkB family carbohydrate kinase [Bacilli bacterium]MDD4808988.1 PfkB family carbohydrate kinase [Bacilli bacterium]